MKDKLDPMTYEKFGIVSRFPAYLHIKRNGKVSAEIWCDEVLDPKESDTVVTYENLYATKAIEVIDAVSEISSICYDKLFNKNIIIVDLTNMLPASIIADQVNELHPRLDPFRDFNTLADVVAQIADTKHVNLKDVDLSRKCMIIELAEIICQVRHISKNYNFDPEFSHSIDNGLEGFGRIISSDIRPGFVARFLMSDYAKDRNVRYLIIGDRRTFVWYEDVKEINVRFDCGLIEKFSYRGFYMMKPPDPMIPLVLK